MELYCFLLCVLICGVQSGWNESNEEEYYFRLSDVNLKGVIRLHHKGFLKANIPYYSNCSASFNIKLLVSGDIQPNPGPDNSPTILTSESLKKSRIKYSREELQVHQYGRQAVPYNLSADVWRKITDLRISIKKPTHRGCRGGSRKQRKKVNRELQSKPIPALVPYPSSRPYRLSHSRTPCLQRVTMATEASHTDTSLSSVYMTNARSLNNKFDEFYCMVQDMEIDLVCVSETWLKDEIPQSVFSIPDYTMFWKNRQAKQGGGVALYAKSYLNPTPTQFTIPADLEILWVQLHPRRLPRSISSIFVAAIYSPPDNGNNQTFIQSLVASLDDIFTSHPGAGIIISGDFNRLNIAPLLNAHRLKQVVNLPTRNDATLDKIVTNMASLYKPVELVSPVGLSDHNGVSWRPRRHQIQKNEVRRRVVRPVRESGIRSFGDWITHKDWTSMYTQSCVERKCDLFYSELNSAIDLYFPSKSVKIHVSDKPWITTRVKALIKQRQAAFLQNSPSWHTLRNKVQRQIKRAKKSFYHDRVQNLKQENPRSWYQYIKLMTSNVQQEMSLSIPGVDPSDVGAIAKAINSHFVGLSDHSRSLDPVHLPAFRPFPVNTIPSVQPLTVYRELSKVKVGKSGGPDGISSRLIREFSVELSSPLCHIMNASFEQGVVPSHWKKSIIVPLPKESPPSLEKLRPIALTDHFAKLLELFVYRWFMADIGESIDPQQFGNRRGMSTSHYLLSLMDYLQSSADKPNTVTSIVLTDFSKAFDLVDHNLAINNLYAMGARPSLIQWLCSFLTKRTQQVRYRGQLSPPLTTKAGVPQGTRLGPLIFLGVVNEALRSSKVRRWKYVDDLTFAQSCRLDGQSTLQGILSEFEQWCKESYMRLNPLKCKLLRVAFTRRQLPPAQVQLQELVIPDCQQVKLLGIIIRSDLKWDDHVSHITSNASRKLYLIRLLKRFGMPTSDLITLFTSYIRPILEYCCIVWHSSLTLQQIATIETIQKRALRMILGTQYESYDQALLSCNMISLKARRDELCRKFAAQLFRNFRDWLPEARSSRRQLRNGDKLIETRCRTERYRKSAIPYIVRLLNTEL